LSIPNDYRRHFCLFEAATPCDYFVYIVTAVSLLTYYLLIVCVCVCDAAFLCLIAVFLIQVISSQNASSLWESSWISLIWTTCSEKCSATST